jgi:hypothetical protein
LALAARAWGTVREDWRYFPFDDARSRAYRWSDCGLAGLCEREQRRCFALTFWNGCDPILKEQIFGVSGPEGNHGEDAKEYWWDLDATPTASWLRWRYHYPQAEFPMRACGKKTRVAHETIRNTSFSTQAYSTAIDTGKSRRTTQSRARRRLNSHHRAQCRARVGRAPYPADAVVSQPMVLGGRRRQIHGSRRVQRDGRRSDRRGRQLGHGSSSRDLTPQAGRQRSLFCENESNVPKLFDAAASERAMDLADAFTQTQADRIREADEYYVALRPEGTSDGEAMVMRQAFDLEPAILSL